MGEIPPEFERYSTQPLQVKFPSSKRIRQVSCGAIHIGAVTTLGEVYMWGCANGGRLGLGKGIQDMLVVPTRVSALASERVWQISCGNAHSALCTEIRSDRTGAVDQTSGGQVWICGSGDALGGKQEYSWRRVESSLSSEFVQQVSCGFGHTGVVTSKGEVYSKWDYAYPELVMDIYSDTWICEYDMNI